jgi:hypothetical protein
LLSPLLPFSQQPLSFFPSTRQATNKNQQDSHKPEVGPQIQNDLHEKPFASFLQFNMGEIA